MENYLAHHGILHQRWGIQNGPPYPLSRGQMSKAQLRSNGVSESAKEKYGNKQNQVKTNQQNPRVQQSNTQNQPNQVKVENKTYNQYARKKASEVYNNRANYSNQELQDYLNRVKLEKRLSEVVRDEWNSEHKVVAWLKKQGGKIWDTALNSVSDKGSKYVKEAVDEYLDELLKESASKQSSNNTNTDIKNEILYLEKL